MPHHFVVEITSRRSTSAARAAGVTTHAATRAIRASAEEPGARRKASDTRRGDAGPQRADDCRLAQGAGVRRAPRRTDRRRARHLRGLDCSAPLVTYRKTKRAPFIGAALRDLKNAGIVPAAAIRDSSPRTDVQPAAFNSRRPI